MYRLIMIDERYNWDKQKIELHTRIAKTGIPTMEEAIELRKKYDKVNTKTAFMVEKDDLNPNREELQIEIQKTFAKLVNKIADKF